MPGKYSSFCRLPGSTTLASTATLLLAARTTTYCKRKQFLYKGLIMKHSPDLRGGRQETFPNPKKLIISSSLLSQGFTMKLHSGLK